ncbi:MAG TPA: adenine deaminase C-terminal domain-containing protein [Calditerricola sp.]
MKPPIPHLTVERRRRLTEVAMRQRPATAWIRGGRIYNVYTGELLPAEVVLWEDRIAYVGERAPLVDDETTLLDAEGLILVPGYLEPHAHPFLLYNPFALAAFALRHGTTGMVNDNLYLFHRLDVDELEAFWDETTDLPVRMWWWVRLDPQNDSPALRRRYTPERTGRLLAHPAVLQAGELTAWPDLLAGDAALAAGVDRARALGKRVEGHNPGASVETLNAVAAAGVTACHEAITGDEVLRRLRLGLYATLRHSSIRPDVPTLVRQLVDSGADLTSRLMLTTDGSTPPFLRDGFLDAVLREALAAGLPPLVAYRAATLNVAVYYGLDGDIGGIAPGRVADINFLEDLANPTPVHVMSGGRLRVQDGQLVDAPPPFDWSRYPALCRYAPRVTPADPDWFRVLDPGFPFPVMDLVNVITRPSEGGRVENGEVVPVPERGELYVALLSVDGRWITTGILRGFGVFDAFASSFSGSGDVMVLGRDRQAMARAVNEVCAMGGGMVLLDEGREVYRLRLPLGGCMSDLPMDELMDSTDDLVRLLRVRGYRGNDPLYALFFLSATNLPFLRLTADGILDVKGKRILVPSRALMNEAV